tara:strand:+ start:852 stop:1037 length:186 start_codon:yes stop_codon:yes gene_type:complete
LEEVLREDQISNLRKIGVLNSNEIAMTVGDLIVAENVVTRERRVVPGAKKHLTESKVLLKG